MIALPYRFIGLVVGLILVFIGGVMKGRHDVKRDWDEAVYKQQAAIGKAAEKSAEVTTKVVTEYVDRIQRVEVRVPVVRERVVRLCDAATRPVLPGGTQGPDGAAASDASDRRADELAADLIACKRIKEKLISLQEWKKAHGG